MSEPVNQIVTRDYQRNIIDVCIERNSIIFLPTGSGKTFIAIEVIKHFSKQLEKKYSEGGKRSFFLVNTIFLAQQQKESIEQRLPFKVGVLTGDDNVDAFDEDKWLEILDANEVLVMTAQCFYDALWRNFIKLSQANVIVFDECHHGRKDHVMHQIMQQFINLNAEEIRNIRIIGLSGTLIGIDNSIKPHLVRDEIVKLESTFQSTIITVNNLDDRKNVLIHSTKAKKLYMKFSNTSIDDCLARIRLNLNEFIQRLKPINLDKTRTINPKTLRLKGPKKIDDLIKLFKDFDYQVNEMGSFGAYLSLLSILIQLELDKRVADTENFRKIVQTCITKVEECKKIIQQEMRLKSDNFNNIMNNSSKKVQKLLLILKQIFNNPEAEKDMQCIVFVQRRSTAKILYHIIKAVAKCSDDFPLRPDFVVGQNNELVESIEKVLSQSFNSFALEKFNKKETNCIVCTNVLEEGIDLQACNLVIMYDHPTTPRSYVQSCGRARDDQSKYIIMLSESNINKFMLKESTWNEVNIAMKNQLIGKTLDREAPLEGDIKQEQQQAWDPFITKTGSVLNALNSINILNQYCMTLPSDKFTNIRAYYNRTDFEDGTVQVGITLPYSSTLTEEIFGERKENVRLAKQHASFEACKLLYSNGNLTDKLTPVDLREKIEEFNDEYFPHWADYQNDVKRKAGTKNNRRYHKMKIPNALSNCGPSVDKTNYLYRINIQPDFNPGDDLGLKVFHSLLENGNTYGIVTTKRIPRLCKMPLFATYGKINCEISAMPMTVDISSESELQSLRQFHKNLLCNVLNVFKRFFVIDKSSYLIVPLDEYNVINWKLVNSKISKPTRLTYDEIKTMSFKPEDYHHSVINPIYRETDQNYVVIDVLEHKSPLTAFPDTTKAPTYKAYFESKNDRIFRDDQFMIEVKGISKNFNLFFPGAGFSGEHKKAKKILPEQYVPELCHNYKFPGDYWLKGTLLLSIFNRLHYLLLAEELREWLIKEKIDFGIGEQVYQLDIDYDDFDERKEKSDALDDNNRLENFNQILREQLENEQKIICNRSKALAIWKISQLPIDIDRNWLAITEVDIDYYCHFIGGNNANDSKKAYIPSTSGSKPRKVLASIQDCEDQYLYIRILQLTNKTSSVQQKDLIKVLTTANAGDVFDMERFETLGDAFLKFIASLFLYKTHNKWHEGYLTSMKGKLVSNRNLFYIGNNFGLSKMIKSSQFCSGDMLNGFAPSCTLPQNVMKLLENDKSLLNRLMDVRLSDEEVENGVMLEENLKVFNKRVNNIFTYDENSDNVDKGMIAYINENYINDKTIADAVEAFLGCILSSVGIEATLKLCIKLKILPKRAQQLNLLTEAIPPRIYCDQHADHHHVRIENQKLLEKTIGYKFENSVYLIQALTHPSFPVKEIGTYENLEFLGDAILDFLITSYISERCTKMSPGKLTDLRSALVNNTTLACIVVRNEIYKFLKAENCQLSEAIKNFVHFQESQNHKVTDEIILLNAESDTTSAEAIDIPKVLGDIFESIIGAVFLDSNLSFEKTWKVIYNLMKNEIHEFINVVPLQIVRRLYEFQQGSAQPKFFETHVLDETDNVAVPVKFKCRGKEMCFIGIGKNRKIAKNAAAKLALNELQKK